MCWMKLRIRHRLRHEEGGMAGEQRVQKMSTEAFSKLRNDHEHFLEAYEKPTQIYRFLKARHSLKPLFLHRTLSYMQHRNSRRGKRREDNVTNCSSKRLGVNDFIKHTRNEQDFASQIKSDNHLRLCFSGLVKGINFQKLLDDVSSESANDGSTPAAPAVSHDSHVMEVEVLLCRFKQPVAKALFEDSFPRRCSCSRLGKVVLEYSSSDETAEKKKNAKKHVKQELSISESQLVWQDRGSSTGTQMLVFRASTYVKRKKRPKKNPRVSKVPAVELNRLNRDQVHHLAKPKQQQPHMEAPVSANHSSNSLEHPPCSSNGLSKKHIARKHMTSSHESVSTQCQTESPAAAATAAAAAVSCAGSNGVAERQATKSKEKKAAKRRDACVMTDLSFGTECFPGLAAHASSKQSPTFPEFTFSARQQQNCSNRNSSSLSPPPLPKKGYTDKCTSPLLPNHSIQNGVGNYFSSLNGYTSGQKNDNKMNFAPAYTTTQQHQQQHLEEDGYATLNMDENAFAQNRPLSKEELLVSYSRTYYDDSSRRSSTSSMASVEGPSGRSRALKSSSAWKRRSEIQLLLDGDKPPGQRVTADEIPVFTAEDLSNRNTRSAQPTTTTKAAPWLGSSTRKITPVEHFAFPLTSPSPKKPSNTSVSSPPAAAVANHRKRSHSDVNGTSSSPAPASPVLRSPLTKQRKLVSEEVMETSEEGETEEPTKADRVEKADTLTTTPAKPDALVKPDIPDKLDKPEKPTEPDKPAKPEPMEDDPKQDDAIIEVPPLSSSSQCPPSSLEEPQTQTSDPTTGEESNETIRTESIYCAELVTFDSRGECLLDEGDYSILMHRCPPSSDEPADLDSFPQLSWGTIFGATKSTPAVERSDNMMLRFTVRWSDGPPKHMLYSELDTALDLKKIRESYHLPMAVSTPPPASQPHASTLPPPASTLPLPPINGMQTPTKDCSAKATLNLQVREPPAQAVWPARGGGSQQATPRLEEDPAIDRALTPVNHFPRERVIFSFLYNNNTLQQTESRAELVCPWCSLACRKLYSLLKHMSLCHPRFFFTYSPMPGGSQIDVHMNKLYDAGGGSLSERDPGERSAVSLLWNKTGPSKRLPCTLVLSEKRTEAEEEDLSEFLNDGSWKRGYNTNRVHYHSRTSLPMLPDELDDDIREETAMIKWQKVCSVQMIEEFTDVNRGEKELMKLWNLFAMDNKVIAEKQIPRACLKFAAESAEKIAAKGLVHNFLAHLVSLCDFGLISPGVIAASMAELHNAS